MDSHNSQNWQSYYESECFSQYEQSLLSVLQQNAKKAGYVSSISSMWKVDQKQRETCRGWSTDNSIMFTSDKGHKHTPPPPTTRNSRSEKAQQSENTRRNPRISPPALNVSETDIPKRWRVFKLSSVSSV